MGKPVRMADIAEQLNISVVSVSKALAGKPGVSEEMRARVVALARQMGYAGRSGAESGNAGGTGNIGVLVSDRFFNENTFYSNLYRSLVLSSTGEGLTCMLEIVSDEVEKAGQMPTLVTGRKVDGLIFMGNLDLDYLSAVTASGLPCILLDFYIPCGPLDCVVSDNLEGGIALTEHLLSQGCREIGFVGSIWATSSIMSRYLGYQQALRVAGIVPREDWLLDDREVNGLFIPVQLPEQLPRAFLCSCDEVAYNLVKSLQDRGLRVPEDVAVCGYDDFRYATLSQPTLTTYQVNVELMARMAVSHLAEQIRHETNLGIRFTVPGKLVIRESSKIERRE